MRDVVIRGEWLERIVYITIIVVLLGLLTYKFMAEPSCNCDSTNEITAAAVTETAADEVNNTEETTMESVNDTVEDAVNETEDVDEEETETEPEEEEDETIVEINNKIGFEVMDAYIEVKNEGTESEFGKVTQLMIRITNGYSHSFSPQLRVYVYEESDDLELKTHFLKTLLDPMKSGTVLLGKVDVASSAVRNLANTKKIKVELYDNDLEEFIERIILTKKFK